MLLAAVLQSDTVDAVHDSDRGHADRQTQDVRRSLLLQYGAYLILCAHVIRNSYRGMREACEGGLAKRPERKRSQDHAGKR